MTKPQIETVVLKSLGQAPRKLLVTFAHPDDESFGPAGTLIHYAQQGVEVHYVCGTRGEAGEVEPDLLAGYDSLGDLRTKELLSASEHLGFSAIHFLNYRDSGMENSADNDDPTCLHQAPLEDVTEQITYLMRKIQPQVVLTFDPQGGYFHPDHIKRYGMVITR
ncbi:MAG: PIG-L family deacetylase [Chloroflexota bacterium]